VSFIPLVFSLVASVCETLHAHSEFWPPSCPPVRTLMAPVIQIEPNGPQTLLLCDDAREDLKNQGWVVFLEKFQGYNLQAAQEFTLTFDGCRAKVGDIQLEITEEFLSEATGLPLSGQKWFKNSKLDEVPWGLFFTS
jgi:hypothetical protein